MCNAVYQSDLEAHESEKISTETGQEPGKKEIKASNLERNDSGNCLGNSVDWTNWAAAQLGAGT